MFVSSLIGLLIFTPSVLNASVDLITHVMVTPVGVVTVSIGVSSVVLSFEKGDENSHTTLLKRADAALYKAKHDGRNRVVLLV